PQDLANVLAECAKDCFLPILRYDDNVVSAIPPDMAVVVPFSHDGVSPSHSLGGSMVGETISLIPNQRWNGRACASLNQQADHRGNCPQALRIFFGKVHSLRALK